MLISEIINRLPASLDWMVLFDLIKLERLFDDITIKKMFLIPEDLQIGTCSHAILTSEGTFLAPIESSALLIRARDGASCPVLQDGKTLQNRFANLQPLFPLDEADCLGLGEIPSFFSPVLMQIRFEGSCGYAKAIFASTPSQANYELLDAVGVKFLSGQQEGAQYVAEFTVDLNQHIFSGLLSNFSRTGYCNAFFLQHGTVGPTLELGLTDAAADRVKWALAAGYQKACEMAEASLKDRLSMKCQPPFQKPSFDFGDLVPLGFLLQCLRLGLSPSGKNLGDRLVEYLLEKRAGDLWPFQSGDIPTATDSALVLLGFNDPGSVQALERFSDGEGGYFPQLWHDTDMILSPDNASESPRNGKMVLTNWNDHWCQSDYSTTCLVRYLRSTANLPQLYPVDPLEPGFEERSGLFFANPYLVDWALALALQGDLSPSAGRLRSRLISEILAGMNPDHTFGSFDIPFSTALAVLSLTTLGYRGRILLLAQLRLAQEIQADHSWSVSTPFYSTFKLPDSLSLFYRLSPTEDPAAQVIEIDDRYYTISYYIDNHRVIMTAVGVLALSAMAEATEDAACNQPGGQISSPHSALEIDEIHDHNAHPRYHCKTQTDYIARWALPPYARKTHSRQKNESAENPILK